MSALDGFRYRLATFWRALIDRGAWRRDVDDEIAFHLELDAMHARHAGHSDAEARRVARRRFGRPEGVREQLADATGVSALDALRQDLRFATRTLRTNAGFTLVACATLALGIGATTSIFSVVNAVLLRPLPYRAADRIVTLGEVSVGSGKRGMTTSYPNFEDWRRASHSFESMALFNGWGPALTGDGEPERVSGALVTAGIFDVLRVTPALGRPMLPSDNAAGSAPVVVLSDGLWRRRFGADTAVIGRAVTLNGVPRTVIGVLPRGFHGPSVLDGDVWGNNTFDASDVRDARYLSAVARLAPNVTLDGARGEMATISARLRRAYPVQNAGLEAAVTPLHDFLVGDARRALLLLLGASGLVLAVAGANLSNLLIARGLGRGREFALRAALGAGRGRVVRQLLVESTTIATLGAAAGVLLAYGVVRAITALGPELVHAQPIGLDARVVAFALVVLVATGVLAGLVPAWHAARTDPQATLKAGGRNATGGVGLRVRDVLAVAQLGLALALLTSAGLLVKSLAHLQAVDPGIRAEGVLALSMNLPATKYPTGTESRLYDALVRRVEALPGVHSAAVTSTVPFSDNYDHVGLDVFGEAPRQGADKVDAERFLVSADYFRAMGIALVAGRLLEPTDDAMHPRVAVVDEQLARTLAPNGSAIGMRVSHRDSSWATIVGIARHVRHAGLDAAPVGQLYESVAQTPWRWVSLVVRTSQRDASMLAPSVRAAVRATDPDQPVFDVTTVDALLAHRTAPRRFVLALLGAFAIAALVLAAVGLYGVMAYGVAQRRRELGVRVSLGASPRDVRRLVLGRAATLATIGGAIGVLTSLACARLLGSVLFDVHPTDVGVLASGTTILLTIAALASYAPARRAARTDPAVVLRTE